MVLMCSAQSVRQRETAQKHCAGRLCILSQWCRHQVIETDRVTFKSGAAALDVWLRSFAGRKHKLKP